MEDLKTDLKIDFEIKLPSVEVPLGTKIEIEFILRNDSKQPLWLNGRLLVNSPHALKQYREVTIEVLDPHEHQLGFRCKVRAGRASVDDYRLLKAGDSLNEFVDLSECFDMSKDGTYTIAVIYEDGTENAPPPPRGSQLLRGPIRSSKKQLRVVAK